MATIGFCKFDRDALSFRGTDAEQAACLLRKVRKRGAGSDPQPIPQWLLDRIGRPVGLTAQAVIDYLSAKEISTDDIGGAVVKGDCPDRRYFVIHDTSSPELATAPEFPPNIDERNFPGNSLNGHSNLVSRVNLLVSRDGRSRTFTDWKTSRSKPGTKLEQNSVAPGSRKAMSRTSSPG